MILSEIGHILEIVSKEGFTDSSMKEIARVTKSKFTLDQVTEVWRIYESEDCKPFDQWTFQNRKAVLTMAPSSYERTTSLKSHVWPDGTVRAVAVPQKLVNRDVKDLTPEEIAFFAQIYTKGFICSDVEVPKDIQESWKQDIGRTYKEREDILMGYFLIRPRTIVNWVGRLGLRLSKKPSNIKTTDLTSAQNRELTGKGRYVITSAQNATPINKYVWFAILDYARHKDAEVLVIPYRYKNPTSNFKEAECDWWDSGLEPHLIQKRAVLGPTLELVGEMKTQPTATNPLNGLTEITGPVSCIVGHPKQQLLSPPILEGNHPKIDWTTGVVTKENYTDSRAGLKGNYEHQYGFLYVESNDRGDFVYQIEVEDDGSFHDRSLSYSQGRFTEDSVAALVLGDLHTAWLDKAKMEATFALCRELKPEYVVLHDTFDGHTCNPHYDKDPVKKALLFGKENFTVESELEETLNYIKQIEVVTGAKIIVVRSNHDDFLDRFVATNWKDSPHNAAFMGMCLHKLVQGGAAKTGLFSAFVKEKYPEVICLNYNDSFKIQGVEVANHGHLGPNGAKGSLANFSKIPGKKVIGHGHTPGRIGNTVMVGTSSQLRMGYNYGPSGWRHGDCIIHKNSALQPIVYTNYEYS